MTHTNTPRMQRDIYYSRKELYLWAVFQGLLCMRWRTRTRMQRDMYLLENSPIYGLVHCNWCVWGDAHQHKCRETYIERMREFMYVWVRDSTLMCMRWRTRTRMERDLHRSYFGCYNIWNIYTSLLSIYTSLLSTHEHEWENKSRSFHMWQSCSLENGS